VTTYIAFIRGINVGGRNMLRMSDLKDLCMSLGFDGVQTLLQSGNVVFNAARKPVVKEIEEAIRKRAGLDVKVVVRSAAELRKVIAANPFDPVCEAGRLIVMFLDREASAEAIAKLRKAYAGPEEIHGGGRELYIDYVDGMGRSKLTNTLIERTLGVVATARNWNTVMRLAEMTA
jgi:uncharacterized protein (DUF1697 family)